MFLHARPGIKGLGGLSQTLRRLFRCHLAPKKLLAGREYRLP
jgi:hypothetical protein